MKLFKRIALIFAALLAFAGLASAQTALTQTTLAAAITTGPAAQQSGITGAFTTQISLASATGVTTAVNGQPVTFAYIDQELFAILTPAPGQTTIFNVLRAQQGTKASPHSNGAMVLLEVTSPQFGGFAGSGGFQATDPELNGTCLSTATLATPWVNIITGAQWVCSPITGTWTPSFNNPLQFSDMVINGATVASVAGTTAVSSSYFSVSGTNAITAWSLPIGLNATAVGSGAFCIYPTGAYTTTATNNIANASTAVVGKVQCWYWNPATLKFGSSY